MDSRKRNLFSTIHDSVQSISDRADRALGYRLLCSDELQGSSWPLLHLMQNVVWATRNDAVHSMLSSHAQLMP